MTEPISDVSAIPTGDKATFEADGPNGIAVRPGGCEFDAAVGVFDGLYGPGYLDKLRSTERA